MPPKKSKRASYLQFIYTENPEITKRFFQVLPIDGEKEELRVNDYVKVYSRRKEDESSPSRMAKILAFFEENNVRMNILNNPCTELLRYIANTCQSKICGQ